MCDAVLVDKKTHVSCDAIDIADLTLPTVSLTTSKKSVLGIDVPATDAKIGVGVPTKIEDLVAKSVKVPAVTGK